jgi:hypothetical protein
VVVLIRFRLLYWRTLERLYSGVRGGKMIDRQPKVDYTCSP